MAVFVKVLIVFDGVPIPAPAPAPAFEDSDDGVVGRDEGAVFGVKGIFVSADTIGEGGTVCDMAATGDVGVFDRVDIDGFSIGVVGPLFAAGNGTAVESGGVVGLDGAIVASAIVTDQLHSADGVFRPIEFTEDLRNLFGYILVNHHLSGMGLSVEAQIVQPYVPKIPQFDRAAIAIAVSGPHTMFDPGGDGRYFGGIAGNHYRKKESLKSKE